MEAFPCGCCSGFRVLLEWNEEHEEEEDDEEESASPTSRSWFYVDTRLYPSVDRVKRAMCERLRLRCRPRDLRLYLDGVQIPGHEPVHVLRPDDHLILRRREARDDPQSLVSLNQPLQRLFEALRRSWPSSTDSFQPSTNISRPDSTPTNASRNSEPCSPLVNDPVAPQFEEEAPKKSRKKHKKSNKRHHRTEECEDVDGECNDAGIRKSPSKRRKKSSRPDPEQDDDDNERRREKRSKETRRDSDVETSVPEDLGKKSKKRKKKRRRSCSDDEEGITTMTERSEGTVERVVPQESLVSCVENEVKKRRRRRHRNKNKMSNEEQPSLPESTEALPLELPSWTVLQTGKHFRFDELDDGDASTPRIPNKRKSTEEQKDAIDDVVRSRTSVAKTQKAGMSGGGGEPSDPPQQANLQNGIESPPNIQIKDFANFPALIGQPRIHDIVAYKMLELSENYTPEVTYYRVGRVTHLDLENNVTIEYLSPLKVKVRRGKFELLERHKDLNNEEEEEEEEEEIEEAEEIITTANINWNFVIDPKLIPNGGQ